VNDAVYEFYLNLCAAVRGLHDNELSRGIVN